MTQPMTNPKIADDAASTARKDPEDWVSGDDPITGAQASYLATLCEQAGEELPPDGLSKAEASQQIDALKAKLKLG